MILECYNDELTAIKTLDEREVTHIFIACKDKMSKVLHVEYKDKDGNCHNLECVEVVAKEE